MLFHCAVSLGEIIDKVTILEIKQLMITDESKLIFIRDEVNLLNSTFSQELKRYNQFKQNLYDVNLKLWNVEDALRGKEKLGLFDDQFVHLARQVYKLNDHRAEIKKKINLESGSRLVEAKSYTEYI